MSLFAKQIACVDAAVGASSLVILRSDAGEITATSTLAGTVTDTSKGYSFSLAWRQTPVLNKGIVKLTRLAPVGPPPVVTTSATSAMWDTLLMVTVTTGGTSQDAPVPVDYSAE